MDRRDFVQKSALIGAGSLVFSGVQCQTNRNENRSEQAGNLLADRTVLFVYGGWEGHNPEASRDLFVPWMQGEGAEVIVSDTHEIYADRDVMKGIDLIVQTWTMGVIEDEPLDGLLKAVREGTGIAGWHGGLVDAYRSRPEYQFMIGGQFVAHPGGVIPYTVHISDEEDPIVAGLEDFNLNTEQYYMHVDPNVKVLATTRFSGEHASWIDECTMPVVWKKVYGAGRVFFSAIGHRMEDHDVPEARTILERGIIWASQSNKGGQVDWKRSVYSTG